MGQKEPLVIVTSIGAVGVLTLNRPQARNALTPELMDELQHAVRKLDDDASIKALLLTGAGSAFSAGADIFFMDRLRRMPQQEIKDQVYKSFQGATRALRLCSKPVVAAVNGPAFGAGCEVAVACDFRIVGSSTVFCENWIEMGAMPPLGGLFLLPRLIGLERASDMVMRATRIDGPRAVEIGLATLSVEDAILHQTAMKFAEDLASKPGAAMAAIKQGLRRSMDSHLTSEWEYYVNTQAILLAGPDFSENVDRINERIRGGGPKERS
jgi:enoyl-CoA hydratase/carnithine racemase